MNNLSRVFLGLTVVVLSWTGYASAYELSVLGPEFRWSERAGTMDYVIPVALNDLGTVIAHRQTISSHDLTRSDYHGFYHDFREKTPVIWTFGPLRGVYASAEDLTSSRLTSSRQGYNGPFINNEGRVLIQDHAVAHVFYPNGNRFVLHLRHDRDEILYLTEQNELYVKSPDAGNYYIQSIFDFQGENTWIAEPPAPLQITTYDGSKHTKNNSLVSVEELNQVVAGSDWVIEKIVLGNAHHQLVASAINLADGEPYYIFIGL